MNFIRMGILAVIATGVAIALIGAGSASATTLCSESPSTISTELRCKSGTQLKKTKLTGQTKAAIVITAGSSKVECKKGSFAAELEQKGEGASGEVTQSLLEECTTTILGCSGAVTIKATTPWKFHVAYTGTGEVSGQFVLENPKTEVKLSACSQTCIYGGKDTVEGDLSNVNQLVTFSEEPITLVEGGALCPKTAKESGKYGISRKGGVLTLGEKEVGEGKVFAALAGAAQLCKKEAVKGECPAGEAYAGPIEIELSNKEAPAEFESESGTISCAETSGAGEFSSEGIGSIASLKFGSCTSTIKETEKVEVEALHLPYAESALGYLSGSEGLSVVKPKEGALEIVFHIPTFCTYKLDKGFWNWLADVFDWKAKWVLVSGKHPPCPNSLSQKVLYSVKKGGTLYFLAGF